MINRLFCGVGFIFKHDVSAKVDAERTTCSIVGLVWINNIAQYFGLAKVTIIRGPGETETFPAGYPPHPACPFLLSPVIIRPGLACHVTNDVRAFKSHVTKQTATQFKVAIDRSR